MRQGAPRCPVSHPFIERLIGTVRREYLDHVFFWNAIDLTRKLEHTDSGMSTKSPRTRPRATVTVHLCKRKWVLYTERDGRAKFHESRLIGTASRFRKCWTLGSTSHMRSGRIRPC